MVVSGIVTPIAMFIAPFNVAGSLKLDARPGGGGSAGVGAALLVVVAISVLAIFASSVTHLRRTISDEVSSSK